MAWHRVSSTCSEWRLYRLVIITIGYCRHIDDQRRLPKRDATKPDQVSYANLMQPVSRTDVSYAREARKCLKANLDVFISRRSLRPLIPGLREKRVDTSFRGKTTWQSYMTGTFAGLCRQQYSGTRPVWGRDCLFSVSWYT